MNETRQRDWFVIAFIKKMWKVQFVRFLLTGGINALVGFSFYSALILLKLHYSLAIFLALIFGVLFNFKSYSSLVFDNSDNKVIFKFALVYLANYFCTTFSTWLLLYLIPNTIAVGAILILPMAALTFFLSRRFVFAPASHANAHTD
jgi:putative flippase GtrA